LTLPSSGDRRFFHLLRYRRTRFPPLSPIGSSYPACLRSVRILIFSFLSLASASPSPSLSSFFAPERRPPLPFFFPLSEFPLKNRGNPFHCQSLPPRWPGTHRLSMALPFFWLAPQTVLFPFSIIGLFYVITEVLLAIMAHCCSRLERFYFLSAFVSPF